ncbi:MAG: hypothetical protein F4103_00480 [Boseongicola sp. SB0673_bin_14]|nr:hypothetical protein [Boseongicola sp. SB0673_bin_14]
MPERTVTDYRLEIDRSQTGDWSDVTDLVEEFEVTYGTDASSSIADVRMRTASGRVRMLNRPETAIEDVIPIRVRDGERIAWEGRCVPSVHEPLVDPDFFYWSLEGKYAHELRKTHDYFIAPQANVGELGIGDFNAFVNWTNSTMRTSWITGEMTPAQLVNRLANVCGGYAVESFNGFVEFYNMVDSMNQGAALLLPRGLQPEVGSSAHINRQSVRTDTKIRATNYVADPANPVPVGAAELRYLFGAHAPLLTFKPAANRNLRIDEWVTVRGPDDVSVSISGRGGRFGRIRTPITGVAGIAELFYVPNIPGAGARTGDAAVFVVDFLANVSRLQSYDIRTARFADAVETFGSVDANLAPWATRHGYQHVIAPWLALRSKPLTAVTVIYTEAQDGQASLDLLQRVQPGTVAAIELPRADGADALYTVLALAVTIKFGRDQLPQRTITGVSSDSRAVVRAFDFNAEAFGPFDGRGVLEIADPDSSKKAYSRYRKSGDTAWTAADAVEQSDESIFAYSSLTPATLYEAEGGLEADYSDALRDAFVTDSSPEDLLACTFDAVDSNGDALTGTLEWMTLNQDAGAFLVLESKTSGVTLHQYNLSGRHVRSVPIDYTRIFPAVFPRGSAIQYQDARASLRWWINGRPVSWPDFYGSGSGQRRGDRLPGMNWSGQLVPATRPNNPDYPIVFQRSSGQNMALAASNRYGSNYVVSAVFGFNPASGSVTYYSFANATDASPFGGYTDVGTLSLRWTGPAGSGARKTGRFIIPAELDTAGADNNAVVLASGPTTDGSSGALYTASGTWDTIRFADQITAPGRDISSALTSSADNAASFSPDGATKIYGTAITRDYNRIYALDDGLKQVLAFDRDGTQCVTQAITPLLTAITINRRPILDFVPTVFDYLQDIAGPGRRPTTRDFDVFDEAPVDFYVNAVPALSRYTVAVSPKVATATTGSGRQKLPDFGTSRLYTITVTDPLTSATSTYKIDFLHNRSYTRTDPRPCPPGFARRTPFGPCLPITTPPPRELPEITNFGVTPPSVQVNTPARLEWSVVGATSVSVTQDGVEISTADADIYEVTPTAVGTITFKISASNDVGNADAVPDAVLTVTAEPPPTPDPDVVSFATSKARGRVGDSYTLTWVTANADTAALDGESVALSGSVTRTFKKGTTRHIIWASRSGAMPDTDELSVFGEEAPTPSPTIDTFTGAPLTFKKGGGTVTFTWTTSNADRVDLNGVDVAVDGTRLVTALVSNTYTLTATNTATGESTSESLSVAVSEGGTPPPPPPPPQRDPKPTASIACTPRDCTVTKGRQIEVRVYTQNVKSARWRYAGGPTRPLALNRSGFAKVEFTPEDSGLFTIVMSNDSHRNVTESEFIQVRVVLPPVVTLSVAGTVRQFDTLQVGYATRRATSAALTTSRGTISLGTQRYPLASGVVADTPVRSGPQVYAIAAVGPGGVARDSRTVTVLERADEGVLAFEDGFWWVKPVFNTRRGQRLGQRQRVHRNVSGKPLTAGLLVDYTTLDPNPWYVEFANNLADEAATIARLSYIGLGFDATTSALYGAAAKEVTVEICQRFCDDVVLSLLQREGTRALAALFQLGAGNAYTVGGAVPWGAINAAVRADAIANILQRIVTSGAFTSVAVAGNVLFLAGETPSVDNFQYSVVSTQLKIMDLINTRLRLNITRPPNVNIRPASTVPGSNKGTFFGRTTDTGYRIERFTSFGGPGNVLVLVLNAPDGRYLRDETQRFVDEMAMIDVLDALVFPAAQVDLIGDPL